MTTKGVRSKRRRLYEVAVAALLSSKDCKSAAAKVGVSYSTLLRWQSEAAFIKLYSDAKRDVLEDVKNNLRQLGLKAVGTLDTTIDDLSADTSDRLSASRFVIDRLFDLELRDDLTARIAAMEASNISEDSSHEDA